MYEAGSRGEDADGIVITRFDREVSAVAFSKLSPGAIRVSSSPPPRSKGKHKWRKVRSCLWRVTETRRARSNAD